MEVDRLSLLSALVVSSVGTTKSEVLEQSNCFAFDDESLITFNGEVFTKIKNPLKMHAAIPATDLIDLLSRFPDDKLKILQNGNDLVLRAKHKTAGLSVFDDVTLPYDGVPEPGEFSTLPDGFLEHAVRAARVCTKNASLPMTTVVHFTSDFIEACDNHRLYRANISSKMEDTLIPASSILAISRLQVDGYCCSAGWLHLLSDTGHTISVRCMGQDYPDTSELLSRSKSRMVKLPKKFNDVLKRAEVMTGVESTVSLSVSQDKVLVKSRKKGGWYREWHKLDYEGKPFSFSANIKALQEIVAKSTKVRLSKNKIMMTSRDFTFVVCLED